ncbi:hypothetical protein [Kordiimonas laminariae]|uniref:hypothetical protein n=1 Tax=Kordiimonas laminariae TaxID=2917717 RepID=UPI001FF2CA06|nr:hypothetical protein [Kordiimonas laminariae]MCK0069676.1 hypothetical protein [Kordiimonas laminariae]
MDLGLAEIAGTLIIGGYAVLGLAITFHVLFDTHLLRDARTFINSASARGNNGQSGTSPINNDDSDVEEQAPSTKSEGLSLFAPVIIGFVFGAGILVENITNISEQAFYQNEESSVLYGRILLTPEWIIRARSLTSFEELVNSKELPALEKRSGQWPKFKDEKIYPLGEMLLKSKKVKKLAAICFSDEEIVKQLVEKIKTNSDAASRFQINITDRYVEQMKLVECAEQYFYHAKNVLFIEPTYFSELSTIEKRAIFGRTMLITSLLHLSLLLVLSLIRFLGVVPIRWGGQKGNLAYHPDGAKFWAFTLFMLAVLGKFAHEQENEALSKRAYGYYVSQEFEDDAAKCAEKTRTCLSASFLGGQ